MPVPIPGRLAEALRRSTVQIRTGKGYREGNGSGAAVRTGQIITNAHVLQGREVTVESWEGKALNASVLRMDTRRDLALLSVPDLDLPSLPLGDSDLVRAGTPVVAIGNPLGFVGAVSSGIVHMVGPLDGMRGMPWIQADVRLAPGNSGGPLTDFQGQLIGINTMIIRGGLALAIPSRSVQSFLQRAANQRSLGVYVRAVPLRDRQLAIMIIELIAGGAAEAASLLPGDKLIAGNGTRFRYTDDLQTAIDTAADGVLRLDFYRGGREVLRQVTVKLAPETVLSAA